MTEKESYKKVMPKLSEEIKRYGKTIASGTLKSANFPIFLSEIPYNGFKILVQWNMIQKDREKYFYPKSKYGWWQYCAQKDELDEWDKKLIAQRATHYGQYRESSHSFCNDNMHEGKFFYNLHPDDMVEDLKQQINIYLRDKEIEIARSKMTDEDYKRIEERARIFLDSVVKENKDSVEVVKMDGKFASRVQKMEAEGMSFGRGSGGWLIKGKRNNYFIDGNGKAYYYNPTGELHLQPICIMPKWDNKYIHLYDHIASRILALMNDDETRKYIHTLKE